MAVALHRAASGELALHHRARIHERLHDGAGRIHGLGRAIQSRCQATLIGWTQVRGVGGRGPRTHRQHLAGFHIDHHGGAGERRAIGQRTLAAVLPRLHLGQAQPRIQHGLHARLQRGVDGQLQVATGLRVLALHLVGVQPLAQLPALATQPTLVGLLDAARADRIGRGAVATRIHRAIGAREGPTRHILGPQFIAHGTQHLIQHALHAHGDVAVLAQRRRQRAAIQSHVGAAPRLHASRAIKHLHRAGRGIADLAHGEGHGIGHLMHHHVAHALLADGFGLEVLRGVVTSLGQLLALSRPGAFGATLHARGDLAHALLDGGARHVALTRHLVQHAIKPSLPRFHEGLQHALARLGRQLAPHRAAHIATRLAGGTLAHP